MMITWDKLWASHPKRSSTPDPCVDKDGKKLFHNQCAIRMGVCLHLAGMDLSSFKGERCYPAYKHKPPHVLRAEELAQWLKTKLGPSRYSRYKRPEPYKQLQKQKRGKKGIVFVKDFYEGGGDHIDLWNGSRAIDEYANYVQATEVWFWEIK
jgi:hypothetical protein